MAAFRVVVLLMRCFLCRLKSDSFSLITSFYCWNAIQNGIEQPLNWIYDYVNNVATENIVDTICRIVYSVPKFYEFPHIIDFFPFDAAKLRLSS